MNRHPDQTRPQPAGATTDLATPVRCLPRCTGCGACVAACPARALSLASAQPDGRGAKTVEVAACRCTGCGGCLSACPRQALVLDNPGRSA